MISILILLSSVFDFYKDDRHQSKSSFKRLDALNNYFIICISWMKTVSTMMVKEGRMKAVISSRHLRPYLHIYIDAEVIAKLPEKVVDLNIKESGKDLIFTISIE